MPDWTNVAGALAGLTTLEYQYLEFVYLDRPQVFAELQMGLAQHLQLQDRALWRLPFVDVMGAVKGALVLRRDHRCPHCQGTGYRQHRICGGCGGSGMREVSNREWGRMTGIRYDRRAMLAGATAAANAWFAATEATAGRLLGRELNRREVAEKPG